MKNAFSIIPLTVEARGEIITNNLPEFRELVREALSNINRDLQTDEQFGQAEIDCKALKAAEETVRAAALQAFDDKLKELVDGLNDTAEEIRAPRLELEKLIAKRKDEVKDELIQEAAETFHAMGIDPGLVRKHYLPGLQTQIKGKRTLDSMRTALRIYASSQQVLIAKCREILDTFERGHGTDMTMDRRTLELEKPEGLEAELRRRFEAKRAAEEKRLLEAEAAKARAETAKAQAELAKATAPAPVDKMNPHNLPAPPKIGSIPVGNTANVVPFQAEVAQQVIISEADEWRQMTATVIAAFALIKEHRERLTHDSNKQRVAAFGAMVNDSWKATSRMEVTA